MIRSFVVLVALAGFAGCAESPGWSEVSAEDHPEAVAKAKSATQALFKQLSARLQGAVQEIGLAGAIEVCQTEAPAIAKAVSNEQELKVGRTSHRLRNRANAPPVWVADLESRACRVYAHPDGRIGVTLPILAMNLCLKCHGTDDCIPTGVKEALAKAYPEDEAHGFAPGDIRGQFWVEIPAKQ